MTWLRLSEQMSDALAETAHTVVHQTHESPKHETQNHEIEDTLRRERARLLGFIRARVHDEDDAQDILQDVFSRFIEAYRRLESIERVTAWLFQVTRNRIIDLYRKAGTTQPRTPPPREFEALLDLEDVLPDLSLNPEQLALQDVMWDEIEAALEELPVAQRDAFVLHELEGISFRDMASMTGESENTLRLRKHYAMRSLRHLLESLNVRG